MRRLLWIPILCAAAACVGARTENGGTEPAPNGSGVVIRGSEMSGTLLDGLRIRYPQMKVSTVNGQCPSILFRGIRSARNQGNPSVYVDGTHMIDTCILTQISARDVDRVEIYPSGLVSNTDVQRNPFGVIMVYRIR